MATAETDTGVRHTEEFRTCVADYRRLVEEIREVGERMARCLEGMRAEGAPRQRLLVADFMLQSVRQTVRASRGITISDDMTQPPATQDRAA